MVVQIEPIVSQYRVELDKSSVSKTKNELKTLTQKQKIELDLAKAQLDLKALNRQLKATRGQNKIKVLVETNEARAKVAKLRGELRELS